MIVGIDHIVILVDDLETAVAGAASLGFTVTPGGQHNEGGTHNALVVFADGAYIELLAFTSPPDPEHYFANRFRIGPGLADFALATNDIDHDVETISAAGLPFPIPTQLSRHRPDGEVAAWRMSLPQMLNPGTAIPFLIQDLADRALRVPADERSTTHPNGALGVAGISVVVSDLSAYQAGLLALLQASEATDRARFRETRGVAQVSITPDGQQSVAILQPTSGSMPERHLQRAGNSIYAVTLRTKPDDPMSLGAGRLLDARALGGANIYLQS